MKPFKRFLDEAESRVGSSIFKLSKAEMKELRRIVKKSGSKVLSVASLAARPKVARDMIRKHGNASVLEESDTLKRMLKNPKTARFASAQMKADRINTLTRMLKDPKLASFAAAQIKADRMMARNEESLGESFLTAREVGRKWQVFRVSPNKRVEPQPGRYKSREEAEKAARKITKPGERVIPFDPGEFDK